MAAPLSSEAVSWSTPGMYRDAAARSEVEGPEAELAYDGVNRGGKRQPGVGLVQAIVWPAGVGAVLAKLVSPSAGLLGLALTGAGAVWWWRRAPTTGVVLRVEKGELSVIRRRGEKPEACFQLRDLVDVALDTKTIQRVEDGGSAIPALRFIDSRVGPSVDTARIVLVRSSGASLPLTEAHVAYMDATEWLGKIRVFLRKHGWVPADERETEDDDEEDADEESAAERDRST